MPRSATRLRTVYAVRRNPINERDRRLAAASTGSLSSSSTLSVNREIGPEMQMAPCSVQLMP